ncbi:hypothetical protein R1flu_023849 [Riccia fluitans]|uniref:RNase H type-1 domain-containing protein n=1 Tax=Riccia fluitans TaxID=41844 RepID=A0ABD1XT71_9MARC
MMIRVSELKAIATRVGKEFMVANWAAQAMSMCYMEQVKLVGKVHAYEVLLHKKGMTLLAEGDSNYVVHMLDWKLRELKLSLGLQVDGSILGSSSETPMLFLAIIMSASIATLVSEAEAALGRIF